MSMLTLSGRPSWIDICPNIVSAIDTTRVLWSNQEMWIDFSSWLVGGKAGMYVVATLRLEVECGVYFDLFKLNRRSE